MHIKQEKISPNGRPSVIPLCSRALFKAAVQKKMKRYMVPSKKHDAIATDRIRVSTYQISFSLDLLVAILLSPLRIIPIPDLVVMEPSVPLALPP
jgi:hypothetical protein